MGGSTEVPYWVILELPNTQFDTQPLHELIVSIAKSRAYISLWKLIKELSINSQIREMLLCKELRRKEEQQSGSRCMRRIK